MATPRLIPQQQHLQQLQNGREPCILCKKEFYFEMNLHSLNDFLETFPVHSKIALDTFSLM
jgi:hypothetical protein